MTESDRVDLTDVTTRLAGLLFSEETLQSALDLTTRLCCEMLAETAGAGVTLIRGGKQFTASYSDEFVEKADALQYELDEGPCLSAWKDNVIIRIDDMSDERRWPRWTSPAEAMGLHSVLSAPLRVRDQTTGAIKVYSQQRRAYGYSHGTILQTIADQAAVVLANVEGYLEAHELSEQLKDALRSRDVIGQAKGILMAKNGVDEEGAFALLRAASQTRNLKLRDIAQAVVETTRGRVPDKGAKRGRSSGP